MHQVTELTAAVVMTLDWVRVGGHAALALAAGTLGVGTQARRAARRCGMTRQAGAY